jgi:lipid-binding SYLF domain-containing protein
MKRFLLLVVTLLTAASVFGASREPSREDYVKRIESCEAILREFMVDPETAIPPEVLQRARGIVITNQFRAGFFLGIKDGYGVILVRRPDGTWSVPALLNAGEASVGLQIGGTAVETVYLLMDDATPRLLFQGRFNVGADAKAVAGPRVAEGERVNRQIMETPVLVYTKSKGLFAGATVKAGWIQRNDSGNHAFYQTEYTLPEIIYSDWVQPPAEVLPLRDYVAEITR